MRIDSTKIMMSHGKMTPPLLNRSNPYHCTIASGRFARAAVGAQRRANEDAQALQTMARCGGLPRESLVAFATVILDNLLRQLAPTQDTPGCVLGGLSNVDDHPG